MRLFLIRHAETVDNVAGLYAGVRDSILTNYGVDQANRLGDHLAKTVIITHIFASPLTRTSNTAEAIRKAQVASRPKSATSVPDIIKVPELIEQDFGFYEGKSFQARAAGSKKSGKETHRDKHKDDPGFVDVESKESMAKRADRFLDQHLLPLFDSETNDQTVAIVSHGILLSNFWRRLLLRLPRRSLTIAAEVTATKGDIILEHLGGWSNTGYLHISIQKDDHVASKDEQLTSTKDLSTVVASVHFTDDQLRDAQLMEAAAVNHLTEEQASTSEPEPTPTVSTTRVLEGYSTKILAIDDKQHLAGLKRQRGGIGRSAHDESQKKLDGFFKKQRVT